MAALAGITAIASLFPFAAAASEFAPNLFFNWTFYPHDAVLTWSPDNFYETGEVESFTPLWNMSFEGSPWSSYERGQAGLGISHYTATDLISNPDYMQYPIVSLNNGYFSDLYLAGEANATEGMDGKVNGFMDNKQGNFTILTDRPGWIGRMSTTFGAHDGSFAIYNGTWRVDSLVATMGIQTHAPSWDRVSTTMENFAVLSPQGKVSLNPKFEYSGQWFLAEDIGGVGNQPKQLVYHISAQASATVTMEVPPGTALVSIKGLLGPEGSIVMLNWNPDPPFDYSTIVYTYAPWVVESLLAFTVLDPAVNYTLEVSQADVSNPPANRTAALTSATFYSGLDENGAQPEQPNPIPSATPVAKNSSNAAAIGGGVGGGVGGLLLLGLLAFCCWKKRKPKRVEGDDSRFEVDEIHIPIQPWVDDPTVAAAKNESDDLRPNGSNQAPNVHASGDVSSPMSSTTPMAEHKRLILQNLASPSSGAGSSSATPSGTASPMENHRTGYDNLQTPPSAPATRRPAFTQEEDAGAIPQQVEEDEPERIPPSYNPEWRSSVDPSAGPIVPPSEIAVSKTVSPVSHPTPSPGLQQPRPQGGRPLPLTPGAS